MSNASKTSAPAPYPPFAGRKAAPQRIVETPPTQQLAQLPTGSQHLVLPEWTPNSGPTAFQVIGADDGGTVLTGMGQMESADIVEYALLGMVIDLINIGTKAMGVSADNSGSPANTRYAADVTMAPGTTQRFICGESDGVKAWYPDNGASGSGGASLFPISSSSPITGDFTPPFGQIALIDESQDGSITVTLPAANSAPNGSWVFIRSNGNAINPGVATDAHGDDTIDLIYSGLSNTENEEVLKIWLVTDGVSNWTSILVDNNENFVGG